MMQLAETLKEAAPVSAASIFQQEWRLYRKIVDHNYAFHREAYGRLRLALDEDAKRRDGSTRPKQMLLKI
jgi:hypothetical protein